MVNSTILIVMPTILISSFYNGVCRRVGSRKMLWRERIILINSTGLDIILALLI